MEPETLQQHLDKVKDLTAQTSEARELLRKFMEREFPVGTKILVDPSFPEEPGTIPPMEAVVVYHRGCRIDVRYPPSDKIQSIDLWRISKIPPPHTGRKVMIGEGKYDEFTLVVVTDVGEYGGENLCAVGEYLLLDENGRDVLGAQSLFGGRNPGKWDIDWDVVASLGDLVRAADRVLTEDTPIQRLIEGAGDE